MTNPHREGMGALPYDGGCAFRVWAPHADSVAVTGDFNGWDDKKDALAREESGMWYGDVPGAKVGDQYKYAITNGKNTFSRIDPYAREVTNSVGNGVIYDHGAFDWRGDDHAIPSHNELVIYEMHIGSFVDTPDGPATFEDVQEKFGHLRSLGVNALQVMPVMEFAGDYSWGYNPAHIFAVESAYGGPDAFKTFVRTAHEHGFSVFLDVVYNHFGPSDLDLWTFDGWSENDKGGIYFFQDHRSATPWGDTRPDYGREEVRRYIRDNAVMWFEDYHVDGLRYDMTPYMRSIDGTGYDIPEGWELTRQVNAEIRDRWPGRILVAEDLHGEPRLTDTGDDGALFHAQWDAKFVHPVREAAITPDDARRSMVELSDAVLHNYGHPFDRVVYSESHDEVANGRARVPQEVEGDNPTGWPAQKRSTTAAALVMTSPGIPMIFQGQEFLEGEWFRDDVPLDWDKRVDFRGITRLYRDLIRLRRNLDGDTRGLQGAQTAILHADEDANVLAFHRWWDGGVGDDVLVVVNLSADPVEGHHIHVPHPGKWTLKFNSDAAVYSSLFGDFAAYDLDVPEAGEGVTPEVMVRVGPYSVLVYAYAG